jgi:hypothetical protein
MYSRALNRISQCHWREKHIALVQAQVEQDRHQVKLRSMCTAVLEKWQMTGPLMLQILTRLEANALTAKYHNLKLISKSLVTKAEACRATTAQIVIDMCVLGQLDKAGRCHTEMCQKAAASQGESNIKGLRDFVKSVSEEKRMQLADLSA